MPRYRKRGTRRSRTDGSESDNHEEKSGEEEEEKKKWSKSEARKLLYNDLKAGLIPLHAKDSRGKSTMKLRDIYNMHDEFKEFAYSGFSSRVSSARKTVRRMIERRDDDQDAYNNFVSMNDVVMHTSKGYIQWKGSEAHKLCLKHVKEKLHDTLSYRDIYGQHRRYYENFPFKTFKDHYRSEIRASKYVAHRKKFGETHKSGKPQPEPDEEEEEKEA